MHLVSDLLQIFQICLILEIRIMQKLEYCGEDGSVDSYGIKETSDCKIMKITKP